MKKMAFVLIYFGNPPIFLNLFLKGCTNQKDIDFFLFTDWDYKKLNIPNNCICKNITIEEFNQLASYKTQSNICLKKEKAYKLCDFKPAWPNILEDFIKDYDYVGWCDMDLIFGNISKYINEDFDILTDTNEYVSGAFTIIKNTKQMRSIYKNANKWKEIFEDPDNNYIFDEFINIKYRNHYESYKIAVLKDKSVKYVSINGLYEKLPLFLEFNNGRIYSEGKEWLAFHYVVAKQNMFFTIPNWHEIGDLFYVNRYGFYLDKNKPLSLFGILFNKFTRKQVVKSINQKMFTVSKLLLNMDLKKMYAALVKQIKG